MAADLFFQFADAGFSGVAGFPFNFALAFGGQAGQGGDGARDTNWGVLALKVSVQGDMWSP